MPEAIAIWPTDVAGWVALLMATAAVLGIFWRGGRLEQKITDSINTLQSRVSKGEKERADLQVRMHRDDVERTSMHNEIGYLKGGLEQVIKRMEAREERGAAREERRIEIDGKIAERLARMEERMDIVGGLLEGFDRITEQMRLENERGRRQ